MTVKLLTEQLIGRLHSLISSLHLSHATLLEITCHGSFVISSLESIIANLILCVNLLHAKFHHSS